jgi:hypothetical protein
VTFVSLENGLTGEHYRDLLETLSRLCPHATPLLDAAPQHISFQVLSERWIGKWGTMEWPQRSPDYIPLEFFPVETLQIRSVV